MNANEKIEWLNEHDPFHEWALDDDIYCLHCDAMFKAQDVASLHGPTCPLCHESNPIDFHGLPWWREDLIEEVECGDDVERRWIGKPIQAIAGKPQHLPARPGEPSLN